MSGWTDVADVEVTPLCLDVGMKFDVRDHLDRLRGHETSWLLARCDELVAQERRIHVEKLAVLAILDERRAIARDRAAREGIS